MLIHLPSAAMAIVAASGAGSGDNTAADSTSNSRPLNATFSEEQLDAFAAIARADGAVLLQNLLDPQKLRAIRQAFKPVLAARIKRAGPDRGPGRYYGT